MLKKLRLDFSSLFGLLLLAVSIWAIAHELRGYNYHDVFNALAKIPKIRLSGSIWLTALGYLVMIWYDILGFNYIGHSIAWKKVAFTGFISSVLGNTIGFALLTGSAIRYRFYSSWGVSALSIAQVIAFANLTFWLGVFAVAGVIFIANPLTIPPQLHLPFATARPLGVIFILLIAAYLLGSVFLQEPLRIRSHEFRFPSFKICLAQIVVSSFDWMVAAAVLYILLPVNTPISYLDCLGIYSLAMFAGVVSNVPAGLGVFEIVVLHFLSTKISPAAVLGSTLAYRAIYDLLSLLVAGSLLGFYEIRHGRRNYEL
ncbi:MAG: UPF0104 family protein [Stigonema ocellatum SAG 48.90 = DSM 106950]|nr:UPF0104 family protein [Stigonema ocellatum SAG 48.90 = DSM 106950]